MLRAWGAPSDVIEDTLRWATFGLGLAQMNLDDSGPPVLGIVVDETEDEDLARMFAIRERLDDDEFLAQWKAADQRASRVLLDSTGPHALLRYTVGIERPEQIERQFLFLVHALAPQLTVLQQPGTELVLIPQRIAQRNAGVTTGGYEVISYCLPLGTITEPLAGLTQALAHVGSGGPRQAG
jgi:hypothetical protein